MGENPEFLPPQGLKSLSVAQHVFPAQAISVFFQTSKMIQKSLFPNGQVARSLTVFSLGLPDTRLPPLPILLLIQSGD